MGLQANLTRHYAVALVLVAGILLASHVAVRQQAITGAEDGAVINRAGMQRMLSQRIALLTGELSGATNPVIAARLAGDLQSAVRRMDENHAALSTRALSGSAERRQLTHPDTLYFGEDRLDERVRDLLAAATELVERHREGGLDAVRADPLADRITSLALAGLLDDLDAVVQRYEAAFDLGTRDALRLGTLLLVIALAVLACEARFIFRPMVHRVAATLASLEGANGQLRQFIYLLSHDLRAPLVSSRGLVSVMDDSLHEGDIEDARKIADLLDGSLNKMDVLIDDLTEVVRSGQLDIVPEPVDLHGLVDEVIASLSGMPGAEAIKIDTDVKVDAPVLVKQAHLRSALENLVSNAIKYRDPEKSAPHLRLSVSRHGRRIRIEVSDNGLGIPESSRPQVFEMFKRFHPRAATGSGLGLHLVRLSMQAVGGRVDYEPLAGGSRFSLHFDEAGAMVA